MFIYIPAVRFNLYRMFFADFPVNSQPIFIKFGMDYLRVTRRLGPYLEIFIGKYCIAKKLDHLACNAILGPGLKTNFNLTSLMGL